MPKKMHIKKGDTVRVIAGEYKGKQGKVLEMIVKKDKAIVEGINIISKHSKPTADVPNGGIVKKEAPVHVSNLLLLDPASGTATRIGRRKNEQGKLVRYSKTSGQEIK